MDPRFLIREARPDETHLIDASVRRFAEDVQSSSAAAMEDALRVAERETAQLLPDGLATPGMTFLVAELAGSDIGRTVEAAVGWVWLARDAPHRPGTAWVWDLFVSEEWRGLGVGRALMEAAAESAATSGAKALSLNVFWENATARGLYQSLGYRETNVYLRLDLDGAPNSGS